MRLRIVTLFVLSATFAGCAHARFGWKVRMPAWRPHETFPIFESPKLNFDFANVLKQQEIQNALRTLPDLPRETAFYPVYNIRPPINHGPAFDPAFESRLFVKDGSSFYPHNERQPTYKQKNKKSGKKIEDLLDNAEDLVDLIENIDSDGEDSDNQTEIGPAIMYGRRHIKHGATLAVRKHKLKKSLGKKIKDALPDADELSNTFGSNDFDDGQNNGTETEAGPKIVDESMIVYGRRPSIKHGSPSVRKIKKSFGKKIKDSLADADDELNNMFGNNDSDKKNTTDYLIVTNTTSPETAPKIIDDLRVIGINESIAN